MKVPESHISHLTDRLHRQFHEAQKQKLLEENAAQKKDEAKNQSSECDDPISKSSTKRSDTEGGAEQKPSKAKSPQEDAEGIERLRDMGFELLAHTELRAIHKDLIAHPCTFGA